MDKWAFRKDVLESLLKCVRILCPLACEVDIYYGPSDIALWAPGLDISSPEHEAVLDLTMELEALTGFLIVVMTIDLEQFYESHPDSLKAGSERLRISPDLHGHDLLLSSTHPTGGLLLLEGQTDHSVVRHPGLLDRCWEWLRTGLSQLRRARRYLVGMSARPVFAWYDLWVGAFIDTGKRRVYVFILPCIGLMIQLPTGDCNVRE